jgi:hypothetical protein
MFCGHRFWLRALRRVWKGSEFRWHGTQLYLCWGSRSCQRNRKPGVEFPRPESQRFVCCIVRPSTHRWRSSRACSKVCFVAALRFSHAIRWSNGRTPVGKIVGYAWTSPAGAPATSPRGANATRQALFISRLGRLRSSPSYAMAARV